jgi:hypothetical protein
MGTAGFGVIGVNTGSVGVGLIDNVGLGLVVGTGSTLWVGLAPAGIGEAVAIGVTVGSNAASSGSLVIRATTTAAIPAMIATATGTHPYRTHHLRLSSVSVFFRSVSSDIF